MDGVDVGYQEHWDQAVPGSTSGVVQGEEGSARGRDPEKKASPLTVKHLRA